MGSNRSYTDDEGFSPPSPKERETRGEAVIAIFDIGKTNKKLLLFDEQYKLVYEESRQLEEIKDEDDFPCEDVKALTNWVKETFYKLLHDERFQIKGVNFSGYGASFVLLDESLDVVLPLYNYLKPYSPSLKEKFYKRYGGESLVAKLTASPVLGSLNSGMQLYRLKYERPDLFSKIKYALHLPQYLSFILTGKLYSGITSIGCHTNLWNFQRNQYHQWVFDEGIDSMLPAIMNSDAIGGYINENIPAGIGLHDSSSAVIPYLISFSDPFILLSTGTWCIILNPFNHSPLTDYELQQDCLCFLSYKGNPVKASRLFAGYEHEQQTKRLAEHFNKPADYYRAVDYDSSLLAKISRNAKPSINGNDSAMAGQSAFASRDLNTFNDYETAYHQLISDIISQQVHSTTIVLKGTNVKRIFVDGGFSKNPIYMQLLADAFPGMEVFAAAIPQASALGAALSIHAHWNAKDFPTDIIELKYFATEMKLPKNKKIT